MSGFLETLDEDDPFWKLVIHDLIFGMDADYALSALEDLGQEQIWQTLVEGLLRDRTEVDFGLAPLARGNEYYYVNSYGSF